MCFLFQEVAERQTQLEVELAASRRAAQDADAETRALQTQLGDATARASAAEESLAQLTEVRVGGEQLCAGSCTRVQGVCGRCVCLRLGAAHKWEGAGCGRVCILWEGVRAGCCEVCVGARM